MASLKVSSKVRKLNDLSNRLERRLMTAGNRASVELRDYIKSTFMGGTATGPKRLARNTGKMERNTKAVPSYTSPAGMAIAVKINVPYATTHFTDTGKKFTRMVPVNGSALTVPIVLGANKRPPRPARAYPVRFARNGILFAVVGRTIRPIFSLRDAVTVKTRVDVKRDIIPKATKILERHIREEVNI